MYNYVGYMCQNWKLYTISSQWLRTPSETPLESSEVPSSISEIPWNSSENYWNAPQRLWDFLLPLENLWETPMRPYKTSLRPPGAFFSPLQPLKDHLESPVTLGNFLKFPQALWNAPVLVRPWNASESSKYPLKYAGASSNVPEALWHDPKAP